MPTPTLTPTPTPAPTPTPTLALTLALALAVAFVACVSPAVPVSPGADASPSDASIEAVIAPSDAGDGGGRAARPEPTMTDDEAFRWARSLDPRTFEGLSMAGVLDFAVLGPVDKGVTLWVRGDQVPYANKGCVAIRVEGDAHKLTGEVSRRWREHGDTITEGYTVELGRAASLLGPGRSIVHADGSTSGSGTGCLHVMGHLSEVRADRVAYAGCPLRIATVTCDEDEHVHDACPQGPRTCTTCTHLHLGFTSLGSCMVGRSHSRVKVTTHDCAPCAPDPLGAALSELQRELVGRDVTSSATGPTFFKSRQACEAQKKE